MLLIRRALYHLRRWFEGLAMSGAVALTLKVSSFRRMCGGKPRKQSPLNRAEHPAGPGKCDIVMDWGHLEGLSGGSRGF